MLPGMYLTDSVHQDSSSKDWNNNLQAALVIITKNLKLLKYPSIEESLHNGMLQDTDNQLQVPPEIWKTLTRYNDPRGYMILLHKVQIWAN